MKKQAVVGVVVVFALGVLGGSCKVGALEQLRKREELFAKNSPRGLVCPRNEVVVQGGRVLFPGHEGSITTSNALRALVPRSAKMLLAGCFQEDKTLIFVAFEADSQLAQIEKKAFLNACLRSICLPASVQGLGMQCFYNCLSLVSVVFEPSSQLKQVGPWAFSNTALIRICFPSDVPPGRIKLQPPLFSESRVAEILFGAVPANPCSGLCAGTALRRVMVPFEQKELPVACFSGCGRLKKVIFAVGCQLQELRKDTFAWTSLRSITIPASVKVIKAQCFLGCEDLVSVDFESGSQIRLIERDAFLGSPQVQSTLPDGTQHSSEELNLKGWKR